MKEKEVKIKKKITGQRILRIGVNSFLYFLIGILAIVLITFGFTQTSVFRGWLKDTIVEELNSSMNGEISINKLEGTIFTSVVLKNTLLTLNNDTVFTAEHIEIKTSPLKILFKIIYARKIEIRNSVINLREDNTGRLNVEKLFPPSDEEDVDSTSSAFPFALQVADLQLNNIAFTLQEYSKINSTSVYETMNLSDFRINDLYLHLSAYVDMNKNSYHLKISEFTFNPNFKFFNLKSLHGEFFATESGILVSGLNVVTEESDIRLNAGITDINIFDDFTNEELGNAPLRVQIEADKFSFDDLSTFVSDLNIIKGKVLLDIYADGNLNDLLVNKLDILYNNTNLKFEGNLKNALDFDNLNINANLNGSVIDPADIHELLLSIDIPDYSELGIITIDTLTFMGNFLEFETELYLSTTMQSNIRGFANLNFTGTGDEYDIDINTQNFDIHPFAGINTELNSNFKIKGSGFSPKDMKSDIVITATRSTIGESYVEELKIFTTADNNIIESNIEVSFDTASTVSMISNLDFNDAEDPGYTIELTAKNLNIGGIIGSEELDSKFNIELQAEGKGFDPDSLDLFIVMNLHDSFIYDFEIDSTALIVDIRRNDNGNKIINVISDIADLTISGQYSISTIAQVISAEAELLQKSFIDKYAFLLPADERREVTISQQSKSLIQLEHLSLDYLVDFKDFLTIRFNNSEIEIDGSINGTILAREDSIAFSSTVEINYFKYWDNIDLYFLTKTRLDFNLWNKIEAGVLEDFSAYIFFRTNRLYAGSNFYDLGFRTEIENDSVSVAFNTRLEDNIKIKLKGAIDVNDELQSLIASFDSITVNYNNMEINNEERIVLNYKDSDIDFENFILSAAGGSISLSGNFGFEGDGLLNFSSNDLEWREIGREIAGIEEGMNIDARINLNGTLQGNISDPVLKMNFSFEDITYHDKNLGAIVSEINFAQNELGADIKFIDSLRTLESPKLKILGTIPVNYSSDEDIQIIQQDLSLKIISDNFDLVSLGDAVPYLKDLTGQLNINIDISGKSDDPSITGAIEISSATFVAEANNLKYNLETTAIFNGENIIIEKLSVGNVIGTKYGGTLNGSGEIILDKLSIENANFTLSGDLKVLDKISREANPLFYGDLAIETDGEIKLTIDENNTFMDMPINVTVADVTFQLLQTAYQNTSGFHYRFVSYHDTLDMRDHSLDSLILITEQKKEQQMASQTIESTFDYRIGVEMKTEAKMVVVLSRELNQDLIAVMDGDFELSSSQGRTVSTGKLNLLEGSKLSFIKSFDVTGDVRVEKLDDPILNIVATYSDYYYPVDTLGMSEEIEVAVKIRFNGPLSELAQNFVKDEKNIAVYVGAENIQNDQADPTKSTSDAFLFMIAGKFTDGATSQEINAAANTAANLAGSMLGGFLNKHLGDYVRNVQLRQIGSETKFNLTGRVGDFRYDVGGSTDVFQDLSRANVKIEYPIIPRLLLRVERKEAVNESTLSNEIFNELGLKYRFDF